MTLKTILNCAGLVCALAPLALSPAIAESMMGTNQGMMGASSMIGGARDGTATASGGKGLYQQDCATCHGQTGSGGVKIDGVVSSDLRSPALEKMYHDSDNLLARAILTGVDAKGQTLDPAMPRWRGSLNSQQVSSIIKYLKSLHS
ncbi:c-type cytochrome [Thioclava sp.]|uniref:c-type cytochrome n=1 Tax=Thioclava sp. TaxID=1933450 RepID=UPI003AA8E3CB